MADLKTKYLGLDLKNPVIVSSSGLTSNLENLKKIEQQGAGAVVLKSLFEEQIKHEGDKAFMESGLAKQYPEAEDYLINYTKNNTVGDYLKLIKEAKNELSIPVIASINCISAEEWTYFAKEIEKAGADALELNIFILPSDPHISGKENESVYFKIVEKIKNEVNIPVALKVSSYFSGFAEFAQKLSWAGVNGLVLFNRFFSPDINIEDLTIKPTNIYSSKEELSFSLRWVAILSDIVHCDIAASTGIHDGESAIKQILAGAAATQVCSVLYKEGFEKIGEILSSMENWMDDKGFKTIDDFKGKLSFEKAQNPAAYARLQFIKHYAGIE